MESALYGIYALVVFVLVRIPYAMTFHEVFSI